MGSDLSACMVLQFADGYMDLIVMKECPKWTLLNLLLKVQTGGHIKSKYVEYIKVMQNLSRTFLGCSFMLIILNY